MKYVIYLISMSCKEKLIVKTWNWPSHMFSEIISNYQILLHFSWYMWQPYYWLIIISFIRFNIYSFIFVNTCEPFQWFWIPWHADDVPSDIPDGHNHTVEVIFKCKFGWNCWQDWIIVSVDKISHKSSVHNTKFADNEY